MSRQNSLPSQVVAIGLSKTEDGSWLRGHNGSPQTAATIRAGTAYVGDMRAGVSWFDRGSTDAYLSDSHGTNFISNMFVVLAEARALFAVVDPAALVKVTPTTGTAAPAERQPTSSRGR